MKKHIYPLVFRPVYKDYIWGGKRIVEKFGRMPVPGIVAESWEVCDHPDGMSIIENGEYKGLSLKDVTQILGKDLLGECDQLGFPLLVKIIDSHQKLSIQVHPDEEAAMRLETDAKSEMWYVLEADKGASLLAGFNKELSREEFLTALDQNQVPDLLYKMEAKPGDTVYLPGGTIHAVMEGCLLLEVQQNSNTTYRIFDWHRGRKLHIDEAIESIRFEKGDQLRPEPKVISEKEGEKVIEITKTPYFTIEKVETNRSWKLEGFHKSFQIFFVLEGHAVIKAGNRREVIIPGKTVLVPAGAEIVEMNPLLKSLSFLRITL